ncbi:lysylphosphatidylglycerol synthase transmembrane domain-containing protein [Mesobaculum littorinae]|nr:lysylphosphatidylglycerol synthase transmembrane domain-containing protein [Mesobaculum littorinae]
MKAIKPLFALALLALLIFAFGSADVWTRLRGAQPGWIAAAVGCLLVQTVMMALRWQLVARSLGLDFATGWAVREYFIAQIVNLTMPGGVVGDGARAVRSKAGEGGLKRATQAVVLERAAGQIGLLAVTATGVCWTAVAPDALHWPPGLVRGLALAALGGVSVAVLAAILLRGGRIAALIARCLPTPRVRAAHAALAIGAALLNVIAFAASARAVGVILSPAAALVLIPLVLTAMVIPLGIGGWGWREGAAAALLPVAGATASAGVASGIVFGIVMLITAAPGLPLLFWGTDSGVRDTQARTSP